MKQIHLILCSHGEFAKELVKSAEMIIGHIDNLLVFPLLPGISMDVYRQKIVSGMNTMGAKDEYLCLVDLYGGTPCTTVLSLMKDYHMNVVTGLNLAMLIEVYVALSHEGEVDMCDLAYETLIHSGKKFYYPELKEG